MSDIPIQLFAMPIFLIVVVVFIFFFKKKNLAGLDSQYANYKVAALAQRLQMQIVEGDPEFNLFIRQANAEVNRGPSDRRAVEIRVRLQGAPQGVPLELVYFYRKEQKSDFAEVTWTTWLDCRMTAQAQQAFPPFEIFSRNPPMGPISPELSLPNMATGDPNVDSQYYVATSEPAMAQVLAQVSPAFGTFMNSGIHIVGDGQHVKFIMKEDKAPMLANALYYAEAMASLLSDLARRVGG